MDHNATHEHTTAKVKDPVCGMTVDPANARGGSAEFKGTTYYFCSPKCNERFKADPEKYLDPNYKPGMHAMGSGMVMIGGVKPVGGGGIPAGPAHTAQASGA